jgi:hypothetical protein
MRASICNYTHMFALLFNYGFESNLITLLEFQNLN